MTVVDWNSKKNAWVLQVAELCENIGKWASMKGWTVQQDEKTVQEEHIGTYAVPTLIVAYPGGRLHVDPVGVNIVGGEGRVDLLSYPTMNSMLLIRHGDSWDLYTDSRVKWPDAWGQECFYKLIEALQG